MRATPHKHRVPAESLSVLSACLISTTVGTVLAVSPLFALPLVPLAWVGFAWLGFRLGQASPASCWFVGPAAVVPAGVLAHLILKGGVGPIGGMMDAIFPLVLADLVISGGLATVGAWLGASFEPGERRASAGIGKRFLRRGQISSDATFPVSGRDPA